MSGIDNEVVSSAIIIVGGLLAWELRFPGFFWVLRGFPWMAMSDLGGRRNCATLLLLRPRWLSRLTLRGACQPGQKPPVAIVPNPDGLSRECFQRRHVPGALVANLPKNFLDDPQPHYSLGDQLSVWGESRFGWAVACAIALKHATMATPNATAVLGHGVLLCSTGNFSFHCRSAGRPRGAERPIAVRRSTRNHRLLEITSLMYLFRSRKS